MSSGPATRELDGIVITAELTLISITQGVALYFLVESSFEIIVGMQLALWWYVLAGLLTIFIFWSRTMMHTLTIIRWPLEFIHNFMYIACTLVEAIMFTQITKVTNWYVLGLVNALMVWMTFLFDLRMIRRLEAVTTDSRYKEFIDMLRRDQLLNVRLIIPLMIGFSICAVITTNTAPEFFVQSGGHLYFAAAQTLALAGYMIYTLRFYKKVSPLLLVYRTEGW